MRPAIFLHIQKTAGTSVRKMASEQYGHDNVCGHGEFVELGLDGCRNYDFVSGHFGYAFAREFMDDRYSFTFLREPISRVVSLYTYLQTVLPEKHILAGVAHSSDLKTFLSHAHNRRTAPQLWNNQAWQLFHGWTPKAMQKKTPQRYDELQYEDVDAVVESVVENLAKFDYVGFSETFAQDITTIFSELGAPDIDVSHSNKSKSSSELEVMDEETLELAKEITELDRRVYEAAREMFPRPRAPRVVPAPSKPRLLRRMYNKVFR